MNIVLQDCEDFAIAYLGVIFSKNSQDHLEHTKAIFDMVRQHGLKLKLKKCTFFDKETEYMGFTINKQGRKLNPTKFEATRDTWEEHA